MPIRLFTSGTHQTPSGPLTFTNDDIDRIFSGTKASGAEKIPFVLGHPKNNLPIVGWLTANKIQKYTEGNKVSLGFDRQDADLSDESMDVIRQMKSNKISVRLENGAISHIGLVGKAAVEENNAQNFSYSELNGIFHTPEDILDKPQSDFSKFWADFKNEFKQIFNPNMGEPTKEPTAPTAAEFAAMVEQNKQNAALITQLTAAVTGFIKGSKATANFSADEFKHMTPEQKQTAASIAADLGEEKTTALMGLLKELSKPKVVVQNGSKAKDFGKTANEGRTAEEIVREQLNNLQV